MGQLRPETVVLAAAQSLIAPLPAEHITMIERAASPAVVVVARTHDEQLAHAANAEILFGDVQTDVLDGAPRLRWVQSVGAGVDRIAPSLTGRHVILTSAKGGVVGAHLAEHAMALLLALTRGVALSQRLPGWGWDHRIAIRATQWELTDRSMLIVGFGGAGRALAKRARGFELEQILAVDADATADRGDADRLLAPEHLEEMLGEVDIVALTVPLTPATQGLMDRRRLGLMRPGSILVNVSRGGLVDDDALRDALTSRHLAGAGLDVLEAEPIPADDPWWSMHNVVLTPHIAGGSPRRAERVVAQFCSNLRRYDAGLPLEGAFDHALGY